jgi:hypothetical protein
MARPTKKENRYKNVGRKRKVTKEVLSKLEEAATIDATVLEMCFHANISERTYYRYCDKNPEFRQRILELRQSPIYKARKTVVAGLESNSSFAFSYLKHKRPDEFREKVIIDDKSGDELDSDEIHPEDEELRLEYIEKRKANIRKRALERKNKKNDKQS